jgi:chromate transport protein ChrA
MAQTAEGTPKRVSTSPLAAFVRASCLHIGAAAAAASLRHDLVGRHNLTTHDIDAAYAVSRVTPGTNLLALYALLGHRLGGWRLALEVVAVGALLPASFAVLIAYAYSHSTSPLLTALMAGARAGGVAVLLGAAVRLLKPQVVAHPRAGAAFVVLAFLVAWTFSVSLFAVLLISGGAGALWLRSPS